MILSTRLRIKRSCITTLLLMLLMASSAFAALKPNDPAPTFSLRDNTGKVFSLNDVVGAQSKEKANGVILSFFASWCMACRDELPIINSVVDEMKSKGIRVVIVGFKENFVRINALLAALKVDKPVVVNDQEGKVGEEYGIRFLPVTFFIGADDQIKQIIYGGISDGKEVREAAGRLLK